MAQDAERQADSFWLRRGAALWQRSARCIHDSGSQSMGYFRLAAVTLRSSQKLVGVLTVISTWPVPVICFLILSTSCKTLGLAVTTQISVKPA